MRSVLAAPHPGLPGWLVRRGSWFVAVLVAASVAVPVVAAIGNLDASFPAPDARSRSPIGALAAGFAILLLQLRHSLAAVRGVRPQHWPWSLAALIALAIVPTWWFSVNWVSAGWFPVATAAMVLPRRIALGVVALALVAQGTVACGAAAGAGWALDDVVVVTAYNVVFLGFGVAALYWSARMVGRITELFATRVDLASAAVTDERLRVSRDLHDLLGQSLTAISLKGDLAGRLLPDRPDAAGQEITGMVATARDAIRSMQSIAYAEHDVELRRELDGAIELLERGGVEVRTVIELPDLLPEADALMAWTVREAATNVLRHSHAQTCTITAQASGGVVLLAVTNDGVRQPESRPARSRESGGTGLAGLAQRARDSGAVLRVDRGRQRFRLEMEVPV